MATTLWSAQLLVTYGVVERIRNMLSSAVFKEIEAGPFKELERILSDLCIAFVNIKKKIHEYDEEEGWSARRSLGFLNKLRRFAYDIEHMLDLAATQHLEQKQDNGRIDPPQTVDMLLPADHFVYLCLKLRVMFSDLDYISGILDASYSKSRRSSRLKSAASRFQYIISRQKAGSRERIADKSRSFIPPAFTSSTTATEAFLNYDPVWSWEDTIIGRVSEKLELIHRILFRSDHEHLNIIWITGDRGMGKTTLAKLVYNDVRVSTNFTLVLWALAFSLDIKTIFVEIIRSFTRQSWFYLQRMGTDTLKAILSGILKGKRYLLFLDDFIVRFGQLAEWEELREILEVGLAGSTIIVITSSPFVKGLSSGMCFTLQGLPPNDSWSLFSKCAGLDQEAADYPLLKHIGRSIVDKCHGCPLAIKTLGSMLRNNRDQHSWMQINESQVWIPPHAASSALIISFQNMPYDLVQCFVCYAISPEDRVMSRDQLVYFWMAQGLLHSKDGKEDLRDIGDRYCMELLSRAFLQLYPSDSYDIFLVNNQAQYLALYLMQGEIGLLPGLFGDPENVRYVLWNGDQSSLDAKNTEDHFTLHKARTFLFKNYLGPVSKPFLEGLISKLSHARVLLLDGSEFEELPETIGNLKLLRYLSLAGNHKLQVLPDSVCNLVNLQTLDLSGCTQLTTLPNYMQNLASLRHLLLSVKLTSLPEEALKSWHSLYLLKICNCPNLYLLSDGIAHLTALRVLRICDCPSIVSLPTSTKCLTNLKELSIVNCQILDLAIWDGLKWLRGLQSLYFQGIPMLRKFPEGLQSIADSLRRLIVSNCENLTALPGCLQECNHLLELVIDSCPNIVTLPKEIHAVRTLQVLKIFNCPDLIKKCKREIGDCWHLISHIPKIQLHEQVIKHRVTSSKKRRGVLALSIPQHTSFQFRFPWNSPKAKNKQEVGDGEQSTRSTQQSWWPWRPRQPAGPMSLPSPFYEHRSIDEEKDAMYDDTEIQVEHQVLQTRRATTNFPSASTSTLNEDPGALFDEQSLDTQEAEVEKKVECPKAGASSQQVPPDSPKEMEGDVLPKASVLEEMKDLHSILFLLPEDYEIEKDTLIQLWMAGEHIKEEPMELHGEECFSVVLNNGYLLRSGTNFMTRKDRYRINIKKINELIVSQKDNDSFYLQWKNERQKNTTPAELIQHVSLGDNDIDATTLQTLQKFNQLRTLLFLGNHGHRVGEMPGHLFLSFKKLQALDLSRTHIKELPSSIGHMIHLRYLDLSWTLIEWLPDILCSLDELQTIKLRGCLNLRELPGQLKRLTKLRHVDVDVLRQLKTMPRGIGSLVNLRTLPAFLVGTEDGFKIQELKELNNLSGNFCIAKLEHVDNADEATEVALYKKEHLEKIELRWTASELSRTHNESDAILEGLQPSTRLEELRILCYEGSKFPSWVSNPNFNKLVSITFYKCKYVSELPLIEQLPSLKHLDLIKMNSILKIERRANLENDIAFFRLEKLEIDEMQSLKAWRWEKRNADDFISLAELTINGCPELQELDLLQHLSQIKHLEIRECPKLQSLSDTKLPDSLEELIVEDCPHIQKKCLEKGEDWDKIKHVPNKSIQEVDEDEDDIFPKRPGQPECQYYMKTGDCKFGVVCRFHHPKERTIPAPDCLLIPMGLPLRPGEPLCIFYSRYGICQFGRNCKFDHPPMGYAYSLSAESSADASAVPRYLGSSSTAGGLTLTNEELMEGGSGNRGDENAETEG